jgi:penicillin-binding protein 1A
VSRPEKPLSAQPLSSDGASKKTADALPLHAAQPEVQASAQPDAGSAARDALDAAKALIRSVWTLIRAAAASAMHHATILWGRTAPQLRQARVAGIERAHAWRSKFAERRASAVRSAALRASSDKATASPAYPQVSGSSTKAEAAGIRKPSARRPIRWLRSAMVLAGVSLLLVTLLALYSIASLPLNGGLQVEAGQSALTLEADGGQTFATRGIFKGERLTAAEMPRHLAQAIVAIEDRRFYDHWGVDLRGAIRAAWRNTQAGATREGGSTITQQLARLMFLSPERTLRRKVQEALIAIWLERQLTKEEILLRYFNTAFFGAGAYGVDAAAQRYFSKKAKDLSLGEAAMLAGLVRAPSQLAPTRNMGGATERAETVLQAMVETGAITKQQAEAARTETIKLRTPPETPPGTNYFVDMVGADLRRILGPASGDLIIRTTLNLEMQRLAEGVIERRLEAEGAKKNVSQGALVALAPDGAILAMVGGRDYERSQFNRAAQARRQTGSLFKLFVYLTAFQRGYTPQSMLVDRPIQIGDWEPQNAGGRFRGAVNLRTAFAQSINTVAVQLAEEVGIPAIIETAKRMGIQSDMPKVPSLALGTAEVTLLDMTRAFASVATGAQSFETYAARSISGGSAQQLLYSRRGPGSDGAARLEHRAPMFELLQAVVNEGTGRSARLPNVPAAGKTGTTQEYRDAWFIGFTPDLIVGVWVGNDDNTPMNKVVGGDLPAAIWRDFVSRAGSASGKKTAAAVAQSPPGAQAVQARAPAETILRGAPQVIDTGTLAIRGRTVRLQGIAGEAGRTARQLYRFLRNREVVCEPAGGDSQRCRIDGEDLSEMILAAGGARASSDASPELLAAEEQARAARLGIWRSGF